MAEYKVINKMITLHGKPVDLTEIATRLNVEKETILTLLESNDMKEHTAYTTGQVSCLLGVSRSYVIKLCDNFTYSEDDEFLEWHGVGSHRRIPHHSLAHYITQLGE